jgi:hypothetical protein
VEILTEDQTTILENHKSREPIAIKCSMVLMEVQEWATDKRIVTSRILRYHCISNPLMAKNSQICSKNKLKATSL